MKCFIEFSTINLTRTTSQSKETELLARRISPQNMVPRQRDYFSEGLFTLRMCVIPCLPACPIRFFIFWPFQLLTVVNWTVWKPTFVRKRSGKSINYCLRVTWSFLNHWALQGTPFAQNQVFFVCELIFSLEIFQYLFPGISFPQALSFRKKYQWSQCWSLGDWILQGGTNLMPLICFLDLSFSEAWEKRINLL